MLNKELGFKIVLKDVFQIDRLSNDLLKKEILLTGNLNHISITEAGYNKIAEYLESINTTSISTELLLGILATFAYGHPHKPLKEKIAVIIKNNSPQIFKYLEKTHYNIGKRLNKQTYQICLGLTKKEISYDLLSTINNAAFRFPNIFKENNCYELEYLLMYLLKYCPKSFDKWFLKTNRNDLKAIFVNKVFDPWQFEYILEVHIASQLPFLKTIAIFLYFNISRNLNGITKSKKTIKDLIKNTNLSKSEKNSFILYSFQYRDLDLNNPQKVTAIENELSFFSKNFNSLNKEIIEEFLGKIDERILIFAIGHIKDEKIKKELYFQIIEHLKKQINIFGNITIHDILKANAYGVVLLNLKSTDQIKTVMQNFDELYKKISVPYMKYRQSELWNACVSKMFYYLIIIFIFYKDTKDSSIIQKSKDQLLSVKKGFNHYLDKEFDQILKQIIVE